MSLRPRPLPISCQAPLSRLLAASSFDQRAINILKAVRGITVNEHATLRQACSARVCKLEFNLYPSTGFNTLNAMSQAAPNLIIYPTLSTQSMPRSTIRMTDRQTYSIQYGQCAS